ncbi:MAG: hypothetical protein V4568_15120 [Pseudomonadota bacterium]
MDDKELFAVEEEQALDDKSTVEDRPSSKRHFDDTALAQVMCSKPVVLPPGTARRVLGVMSDTPMSRRTRLYLN